MYRNVVRLASVLSEFFLTLLTPGEDWHLGVDAVRVVIVQVALFYGSASVRKCTLSHAFMIKQQCGASVGPSNVHKLAQVHADRLFVFVAEVDEVLLAEPAPDPLPLPARVYAQRVEHHDHRGVPAVGELLLGQELVAESEVGLHGPCVHGILEILAS